jgi:opacity protein-like surface antigen
MESFMKRFTFAAATAAATLAAIGTASAADPGLYGNLGYTHYDLDDASPGALTARLGYGFNENFAVEGELGLGIVEDDVNVQGTKVDIGIDNAFGVFAVGRLPAGDGFSFHGRLGYGNVEAEASAGGFTVDESADGLACGIGAEAALTEQFGIRADFTRLDGDDGDEADTFSFVGTMKF